MLKIFPSQPGLKGPADARCPKLTFYSVELLNPRNAVRACFRHCFKAMHRNAWIHDLDLDPGSCTEDLVPGPRIQNPGSRVLDPGSRGSWVQVPGSRAQDSDPAPKIDFLYLVELLTVQVPGSWVQDTGFRPSTQN